MNVVTPRKICFRNLNFSFPRIAAGTPSSHPGHSEQLICHRDCPTPWTHGQEFHSVPVLSASFHKHSAIPSGNQIDPGGITASETPTPHPATHQCSSDIPITSQTIPVTPQVLRESLACKCCNFTSKAGNPCTCSCSQIPSPSGAGGNWSSFPAQSVLPLGKQRGEISIQPLPQESQRISWSTRWEAKQLGMARYRRLQGREQKNTTWTGNSKGGIPHNPRFLL